MLIVNINYHLRLRRNHFAYAFWPNVHDNFMNQRVFCYKGVKVRYTWGVHTIPRPERMCSSKIGVLNTPFGETYFCINMDHENHKK